MKFNATMVRGYHMCSYEVMTFMTSFSLLSYVPFPRSIIGEKQVQKGRGILSVPYQPPWITLGASLSNLCSSWEWHTLSIAGYYILWGWYHDNHGIWWCTGTSEAPTGSSSIYKGPWFAAMEEKKEANIILWKYTVSLAPPFSYSFILSQRHLYKSINPPHIINQPPLRAHCISTRT